MAISTQSFSAKCTGCVCVCESRRQKWNQTSVISAERARGRFSCPYVQLHPSTVIKNRLGCRSKWPWAIVPWNGGGTITCFKRRVGQGAIELIQIYIVENSICPSGSSNCFGFTRHQSNLFVCAHQDVTAGLHTVMPIQFATSEPRVRTVA